MKLSEITPLIEETETESCESTPYDGRGHAIICLDDSGSCYFIGWRDCALNWMLEDSMAKETASEMFFDYPAGLYYANYVGEYSCGCNGNGSYNCAGDCFETYFEIIRPIIQLTKEHY